MTIETFVLGDLQTNCYLISDDNEAMIIDPADDGDFLNEELSRRNLELKQIVLTHGHFDHCLGLLSLKLAWTQVPIFMNFEDQFLLKQAQKNALYWLHREVDPVPTATHDLKENDLLKLGDLEFKIIETPGHTPGSICLLNKKEKVLIAGDTIFKNGIGRTDFSYSSYPKMKKSLDKLKELKNKGRYSTVYSGHGEIF